AEWHPTKNGALTPRDVTYGAERRVFWRCSKDPGHVWQTSVCWRAKNGTRCPFCLGMRPSSTRNLARLHPAVAAERHATRNGSLTPRDVMPGSKRKVWWQCARDPRHIWQMGIQERTKHGYGCARCHRLPSRERSLGVREPALAALWHPTKIGALTPF